MRYISMKSIKDAHKSEEKNSRAEQGAWKDRASDGLLMIQASAVRL